MAEKKVKAQVKMVIKAGGAQPGQSLGSILGPTGVNLMQFCKEFNDRTSTMIGLVPAVITIYEDRTFEFILKTAPVSELIKQAINLQSGSPDTLRKKVGTITREQVEKIAEKKMVDLNCYDLESAVNQVIGTCRSMGVAVAA